MTRSQKITFAVATTTQDTGEFADAHYVVRSARPADRTRHANTKTELLTAETGADLVHLELYDDNDEPLDLWLHPENARDLLLSMEGCALAADGTIEVPATAEWRQQDSAQRGRLRRLFIKTVEVLGLKQRATALAASALGNRLDQQVNEGVYRLQQHSNPDLKNSTSCRLDQVTHPQLVLIHGTFSSTQNGFSDWWQHPAQIEQLFSYYQHQVYALDHATVLKSPLHNALTLANALPEQACLHLVTHSRGGLVAECLVRALILANDSSVYDDELSTYFNDDSYKQHRADLSELVTLLKSKKIRIERLVRVACPAHGTLLASDRLDTYLSVLSWLLKRASMRVLPALLDFTKAVARERTDPRSLTGIEAMRAQSAVIRWLNAPLAGGYDSQLRVIAGDMRGDSLTSWIKVLLVNSFYRTDNDMVVQTSAMYGGILRQDARFLLESSSKTDHFRYFRNPSTASAITEALTHLQPNGFQPIGPLSYRGQSASGVRALNTGVEDPSKPLVLIVPGFGGSHLLAGDQREWLNLQRSFGVLQRLNAQNSKSLQAKGLVEGIYRDMLTQLASDFQLHQFAYDWRGSLTDSATKLARLIEQLLTEASKRPLHLIAHGMGAEVFRVMQLQDPALWQRWLKMPHTRVLLLGPPTRGCWAPMQMLSGQDPFANLLCQLNGSESLLDSRKQLASFNGLVQLQAGLHDSQLPLAQQDTWNTLAGNHQLASQRANPWFHRYSLQQAVAVPDMATLQQAALLRHQLDDQIPLLQQYPDKIALILGSSPHTPCGFHVTPQGALEYQYSAQGDGWVSWQSAYIEGLTTWLSTSCHGALPASREVLGACQQWLSGHKIQSAALLPFVPSQHLAGQPGVTPPDNSFADRAQAFPLDESTLLRSLKFGHPGNPAWRPDKPPLSLTVRNDDIRFIRQPLLLGHQSAMQLTGSELAVDQLLGGDLDLALQAGNYPVEPGQFQVFINRNQDPLNKLSYPKPPRVIVVGLGNEGELSPELIRSSVQAGIIGYCLQQARGKPLALAATLLGSGGILSVSQTVQALVQGVLDANSRLQQLNTPQQELACIDRLVIVEQFHNRALEAWHTLHNWARVNPELMLQLDEEIASGQNSISQPVKGFYRGVRYDLLRITTSSCAHQAAAEQNDSLALELALFTHRARSELFYKSIQTSQIRQLLQDAELTGSFDQKLANALYQLILPHELKTSLTASNELLLELDPHTAWIPWELLFDSTRIASQNNPLSGLFGGGSVLRKLRLRNFRRQPKASSGNKVLVIGEPKVAATVAALPGAAREAQQVARLFGADATLLLHSSSSTIFKVAFADDWQIVHLAGHGYYSPPDATGFSSAKTGMLLERDIVFGPVEFESMPQAPELVFVNCCELGKTEAQAPGSHLDFAANVGEQLIRNGVRCVVVAAWPVSDRAAEAFAAEFYQHLQNNMTFAQAVLAGRKAAYAVNPGDNSFAAYQCYGDPGWRLKSQTRQEEFYTPSLASAAELHLNLEQWLAQTSNSSVNQASLRQQLLGLLRTSHSDWLQQGWLAEQIAQCWKIIGDRQQALYWFTQAVNAADGSASFVAQEQRLNLMVRQTDVTQAIIANAIEQLQQLLVIAPTAERYSLLGAAWKRQVMLLDKAPLAKTPAKAAKPTAKKSAQNNSRELLTAALTEMAAAYQQAVVHNAKDVFYPLSQLYLARLRLHWLDAKQPPPDPAQWQQLLQLYQQQAEQEANFWNHIGPLEASLWQAMQQQQVHSELEGIKQQLLDLQLRVSSPHLWRSVYDTLCFLQAPYVGKLAGKDKTEQEGAALAQLIALLAQFSGSGES